MKSFLTVVFVGLLGGLSALSATGAETRFRGVMLPQRDCTEDDFRTLADWGANVARFQIVRNWGKILDNRDLAEYNRWVDGRLDHLERSVLPWAAKYGLRIVLDLHVLPGGRRQDGDLAMFHERPYADAFVSLWRRIARRFAGWSELYGYDLVNEPCGHSQPLTEGVADLQERAAKAVREIDPTTPILIESDGWASAKELAALRPIGVTNVIYEIHMYHPQSYTHQGVESDGWGDYPRVSYPSEGLDAETLRRWLEPAAAWQRRHGARIYVGEFSAIAWAEGNGAYLRDCIRLFESFGWDWSYHAFREWPSWSVEHVGRTGNRMVPSADNPRRRALLEGLRQNRSR